MRAIQLSSFGNPVDVLEMIDLPEPQSPARGEALIGIESAPVNHNDLLLILHSFYQVRPEYGPKIPDILREASEFITSGKLSVPVAATYSLSAIKDAVTHVERGGKVLLDPRKE